MSQNNFNNMRMLKSIPDSIAISLNQQNVGIYVRDLQLFCSLLSFLFSDNNQEMTLAKGVTKRVLFIEDSYPSRNLDPLTSL